MRNRLYSRIQSTQELLRSFRDDLDTQPPLNETRSRHLCFQVSEAEKVLGSMQQRLQALFVQTWYPEDSV